MALSFTDPTKFGGIAGSPAEELVEELLSKLPNAPGPSSESALDEDVEAFIASLPRRERPELPDNFGRRFFAGMSGNAAIISGINRERQAIVAQRQKIEDDETRLFNQIRVRAFERQQEAKSPSDVELTTESLFGTQRLVDQGIIPESALDQPVRVRIATDPATGRIMRREFIGIAEGDEPTTKSFVGEITAKDIASNPELEGQKGERWTFSATVDPETGAFGNVTPVRPAGETLQVLDTSLGLASFGKRTGAVKPLLDESGDQLRSASSDLARIKFQVKREMDLRGKTLDAGTRKDIADSTVGLRSVQSAVSLYLQLGGPQLLTGNQLLTTPEGKRVRAAITAAIVPVVERLSGKAVTESEAGRIRALVPDLRQPVFRDTFEAAMIELGNLMLRDMRATLDIAAKGGIDVSGFSEELSPRRFDSFEALAFNQPTAIGDGEPVHTGDNSVTLSTGGSVVVDENGNLKIEEP